MKDPKWKILDSNESGATAYFDLNGMFIANSVDEIIEICNSLDDKTYSSKIEYVNKNFELSQKFITIVDRLEIKIKEILK